MPAPKLPQRKVILITGCSSGIGQASAERFAQAGHTVYATARSHEAVSRLAEWSRAFDGRAHAARLDVTDSDTIAKVVRDLLDREGRIDVLVNNAGFGQIGAVEDVSRDLWRRQMETNVIGVIAAMQAVLPHMRSAGRGRIINVSSVVAHVAAPLMGAYCASKHALDAVSVALRIELAPFGIDVVLIEPGPIQTHFRANVDANLRHDPIHEDSPYEEVYQAMDTYWAQQYGGRCKTPEDVAALISRAAESARPRPRYRITTIAKWLPRILPFIPDRLFDRLTLRKIRAMSR